MTTFSANPTCQTYMPIACSTCSDCPLTLSANPPSGALAGELWYNTGTQTVAGIIPGHIAYWTGTVWKDLDAVTPVSVSGALVGNGTITNPLGIDCAVLKANCGLLSASSLIAGTGIQLVANANGTITINNTMTSGGGSSGLTSVAVAAPFTGNGTVGSPLGIDCATLKTDCGLLGLPPTGTAAGAVATSDGNGGVSWSVGGSGAGVLIYECIANMPNVGRQHVINSQGNSFFGNKVGVSIFLASGAGTHSYSLPDGSPACSQTLNQTISAWYQVSATQLRKDYSGSRINVGPSVNFYETIDCPTANFSSTNDTNAWLSMLQGKPFTMAVYDFPSCDGTGFDTRTTITKYYNCL